MTTTVPPVFPMPRHLDLGASDGSARIVGTAVDARLPPQGYRLTIGPAGTTIEHRDEPGLRYGHDTLAQLSVDGSCPGGRVEDWPDVTERAYMLDISRDRVPTVETLEWLIGVLARLRYTELQLYTEHTFAWPDHEIVWRDASPITARDLRRLAGTAASHGIQLVPCLNGFGHMERFLRHEHYRHRAECPEGAPTLFGGGHGPPTTLAPTPENAAFARSLFREYLEALPSRRVHVGGDEPFELGRGRSAEQVARHGRAAVYAEHLRRIVEPMLADGHEILFWGDVLRRSPHIVASLPQESMAAVAWWYDAPVERDRPVSQVLGPELAALLDLPEDAMKGFVAHTRTYAETGYPFWVAPGTSTWNSLIGRWSNARANIDDALEVGAQRGAGGMLLADWGDGGHHHPLPVSLLPLVHASGAAWCRTSHRPSQVTEVVDALAGPGTGDVLEALGSVNDMLGIRQFNSSALCNALFGTFVPPRKPAPDQAVFDDAGDLLTSIISHPPPFDQDGGPGRGAVLRAELTAAARLARNGVWRLARAVDRRAPDAGALDADLVESIGLQEAAWRCTSRPGGLEDSLGRLHARIVAEP